MSEENNSNNKKNNNKRRRYNKNKKKTHASADGAAPNKKPNHNKNRRPKALSPSKIAQKYDNLLEQYLIARKKYFEMYARAKGQAYKKIDNNYMRTLKAVFNYKDTLNDWQQESLDKKLELYPEDNQYTTEHGLPLTGEVEVVETKEDIHLLPKQREANYKEDTEESSGTIEDYKKYKDSGI